MEQVERESFRVLPKSKTLALALDADFFKPVFIGNGNYNFYRYDFYHGNGFWLNLRSEFKPVEDLSVNLKFDFTQGTSSNGPTFNALIVPHVGITYREHSFLGLDWEFRLSDIDRQTLANGLFIEQKETVGGSIVAKSGDVRAKLMVDGTGSFRLDGGVMAFELSEANDLLGVSLLVQETETSFNAPHYTGTIFSRKRFESGLAYGAETGMNQKAGASLLYIEYNRTWDQLSVHLKPQFRHYGKGILGSLPGNVSHVEVAYDQNDKPFTSLMNIFSWDDNVDASAAQVDLEWKFNDFYRVYAETEFINYLFKSVSPVRSSLFRTGLKFYPFHSRQDEFGILIGNKYLVASTNNGAGGRTYSPPNQPDFENKALFMKQMYWMINYEVKL
jgi:hypothetical protein